MARDKLKDLWRWRNHLAHGGDEEVSLSENQLRECIAFVRTLSVALDKVVLDDVNELRHSPELTHLCSPRLTHRQEN